MQQAIYTNLNSNNTSTLNTSPIQPAQALTATPSAMTRSLRHLALKWDLYGVLTVMASCAAYGIVALAHVA